jgi:uncharacterized protein YbcI
MGPLEQVGNGQLNAALARAVVRTHSEYRGRGPTKAQAFVRYNVVVVVLEDTMTQAERSLVADGRSEVVASMRHEFDLTMRAAMVSAIEELTGCKVDAFISGNDIGADLAAEVFVLDRPTSGKPSDTAGPRSVFMGRASP